MKLALFSFHITDAHAKRFEEMLGKPLSELRVCFVTTAANPYFGKTKDYPEWLERNIYDFKVYFKEIEVFDIENCNKSFDFEKYFSSFDIVFFSGGNTFYLAYILEEYNLYKVFRDLITNEKIVYSGGSAGAVILSETIEPYALIDDPSDAPKQVNEGYNLLEFVPIVHWEDEKYYEKLKKEKDEYEDKGYLTITLKDTEAVFIDGEKFDKI